MRAVVSSVEGVGQVVVGMCARGRCLYVWICLVAILGVWSDAVWILVMAFTRMAVCEAWCVVSRGVGERGGGVGGVCDSVVFLGVHTPRPIR